MKMYAVVVHFDEYSAAILNSKINDISAVTGNRYMLDTGIAPHITIGAFNGDNETAISKIIAEFSRRISGGCVSLSEIAGFKPFVVFALPVKNKYLTDLNKLLNEMMSDRFEAADKGHYLPEFWVPHCTLATKLDNEHFEKALIEAESLRLPIEARVTEIALAECNPYKEVGVWKID